MLTLKEKEKRSEGSRSKKEATGIETGRKSAPAFETGLPTSLFGGPILRPVSNASATFSVNSVKGSAGAVRTFLEVVGNLRFPLDNTYHGCPLSYELHL
jgi:hypothetical protein